MQQRYDTFQSLFKKTDEFFGLTKPIPIVQADTSAFDVQPAKQDNDDNEESKNSRIVLDNPQIDHLRSTINRVKIQRAKESTIIGVCVDRKKTKDQEQMELLELQRKIKLNVHSDWQDEVMKMMECSSESDSEDSENEQLPSKRPRAEAPQVSSSDDAFLFQPKLRLYDKLRAFDCFESEYVELDDNGVDPLDVLIPNAPRETNGRAEDAPSDNDDTVGPAAATSSSSSSSSAAAAATSAGRVKFVEESAPKPAAAPSAAAGGGSGLTLKLNRQAASSSAAIASAAAIAAAQEVTVAEEDQYRSKAEKERLRKLEKAERIRVVDMGFNAAASIEQGMLLGKRPRDLLNSSKTRVRSLIAALNHSTIATSHKNTKPDLAALELKYFHRPHMIRERDRAWQISCKNSGGAGGGSKKPSSSGSGGSGNLSPLHRAPGAASGSSSTKVQYSEADKQNLSLAHNHVNYLLLEYVEEFPPMMLNFGMASAVFNYFRTPKNVDEEEERRMKQRQDEDKLFEHVLSTANACRLPRHVMLLLQLRTQKPQYDYDLNIPRLPLGETKVLNEEDESPFLGTIEDGDIQQAFVNNLFKAPIFRHSPHRTDFLLIRTKLLQKVMTYSIREIPYIYLCGQLEPQKIVPRPIERITSIQEKYYMLAAARYLATNFDGVDFGDIVKHILKYCLKDKSSPHKAQHRQKLKDIVKKVAEEVRDTVSGSNKWYSREFDDEDEDRHRGHHNQQLDVRYTSDEIARSFSPEDVCLQESCNATEYHLHQQHITDVDLSKIEAWLTLMHKIKQGKLDRAQKVKRLIAEQARTSSPMVPVLERLLKILVKDMQRLEMKMNIARYIFDRLVIAPWNTTEAYVRSHLERDGQGKMELLGIGDPSGIGEGYAFVRILKKTATGTAVKKNTVKLVSTDKDLRKLTKKDQMHLLMGFGVKESDALKLRRWDRVHMIREFSTMAEKTGVAKSLHKYARGDASKTSVGVTGMGALESFGEKCQQIWKRQKASLSRQFIPAAPAVQTKAPKAISSGASSSSKADDTAKDKDSGSAGDEDKASDESSESEDDDEDFAKDIERTLNARAAATATMEANESARLERERRVLEDEKKELSSMKSFMDVTLGGGSASSGAAAAAAATNRPTAGGGAAGPGSSLTAATPRARVHVVAGAGGASSSSSLQPGMQVPGASASWVRPRRVVKRVTRSVNAEGVETLKVEFLFHPKEVDRVEFANAKAKKERDYKRSGHGSGDAALNEEDIEESQVGTTMASMSLNIGKMKKAVDQNHRSMKHGGVGALAGYAGLDEGEAQYMARAAKSTKRSAQAAPLSYRLPRVALAVRLEKEILSLWQSKNANYFWFPVSRLEPGYYERIANPICLKDIREKIASYRYESANALIRDVELMASNAALFNGAKSLIGAAAAKLLDQLRTSINHEAVHFGTERDTIRLMEEAIRKKNVQFQRGDAGSGAGGVSSLPPPPPAAVHSSSGFSKTDSLLNINASLLSRGSSGGGGGGAS